MNAPPHVRRLELAHTRWSLFDEHFDCLCVAERCTSGKRIASVELRRVSGAERSGDSALRVGSRAVEQRPLREDEHITFSRSPPRGMQSGDAAPDNQEACTNPVGHD